MQPIQRSLFQPLNIMIQLGDAYRDIFLLDPNINYLNFGSFGATPKPVFEAYQNFQRQLEADPVAFIADQSTARLADVRATLANYLHCNAEDIVCVTNPSYAVNIVAKSFPLQAGDEVLSTNLEYGACDRTWQYYCERVGAHYINQKINLPLTSAADFIQDLEQGISSKTKLIFVSHITSVTALILPVAHIVALGKKHGIPVFIDGAHAPAHVALDLTALDCEFYTGACHKWMMAPKGASFLYTKKEQQAMLDPLVVSWGYKAVMPSASQFIDYHEMQGTRDFSAFCTIPASIQFMQEHNWWQVSDRCKNLVRSNATALCELLDAQPLAPLTDEFYGQMFSCPITTKDPMALHHKLYQSYKIQIPVPVEAGQAYIRYSVNAFNDQQDIDHLLDVLATLKKDNVL